MRIILIYTPIRTMLECLGFLNVSNFLYLLVYKLYHRELPQYLEFTIVNEMHEHYTRYNDRIYVHKVNRELTKNSLYFRGLEEFNSLPPDVKNSISVTLFKTRGEPRLELGVHVFGIHWIMPLNILSSTWK